MLRHRILVFILHLSQNSSNSRLYRLGVSGSSGVIPRFSSSRICELEDPIAEASTSGGWYGIFVDLPLERFVSALVSVVSTLMAIGLTLKTTSRLLEIKFC